MEKNRKKTNIYLNHLAVEQKLTQCCKPTILQLKEKKFMGKHLVCFPSSWCKAGLVCFCGVGVPSAGDINHLQSRASPGLAPWDSGQRSLDKAQNRSTLHSPLGKSFTIWLSSMEAPMFKKNFSYPSWLPGKYLKIKLFMIFRYY